MNHVGGYLYWHQVNGEDENEREMIRPVMTIEAATHTKLKIMDLEDS